MNSNQVITKQRITNVGTRKMTMTAMLAAISALLMLMEFALPIFPSFVKMDLSDLPALLASFAVGPVAGITVELIKNIVNLIITGTTTGFIGEFANFIIGVALVVPAGMIYRHNKTKKGAVIGMIIGIISMAIVGAFANYFILIPFYTKFIPLETIIDMCKAILPFIDSLEKVVIYSITPFNLLKGTIVSVITFMTYKRLSMLINNV